MSESSRDEVCDPLAQTLEADLGKVLGLGRGFRASAVVFRRFAPTLAHSGNNPVPGGGLKRPLAKSTDFP